MTVRLGGPATYEEVSLESYCSCVARKYRQPRTRCQPSAAAEYNSRMARTVAVIGASSNRGKFGNKALRAFENQGYTVYPINPNEAEVEGHQAYASVLDVPVQLDCATVYVPPRYGVRVMDQLAQKGVGQVWLNPGADGAEVVTRARELGLNAVRACSIIAIGESPSDY